MIPLGSSGGRQLTSTEEESRALSCSSSGGVEGPGGERRTGSVEPRNEASQLESIYCLGGGFDMLCDNHLRPRVPATWVQERGDKQANGGNRPGLR